VSALTGISWCDSTKNLWSGCQPAGPGCDNCYAARDSKRYGYDFSTLQHHSTKNAAQLQRWNDTPFYSCVVCGWRGFASTHRGLCSNDRLLPVRQSVFINSQSDFFDNRVPQAWRDEGYVIFERCTNLDIILLTKRIGNVRKMVPKAWLESWPAHVRMGATMCNQDELVRDIYKLLALPAPVRLISFEPLLSDIDFTGLFANPGSPYLHGDNVLTEIHWVICGGESGPNARPMHPEWARSVRQACIACEVPFHFKQWGEWQAIDDMSVDAINRTPGTAPGHRFHDGVDVYRVGKQRAGRLLDGREWNEFPRPV